MPTILLPAAEVAARQRLITHPDGAALWGTAVSTVLPAQPPLPFVRIEQAGTDPSSARYWITRPVIDFHCYGSDQTQANLTARTVAAVLEDTRNVTIPNVAVILAAAPRGLTRLYDEDAQLDRYWLTATFTIRPLAAS